MLPIKQLLINFTFHTLNIFHLSEKFKLCFLHISKKLAWVILHISKKFDTFYRQKQKSQKAISPPARFASYAPYTTG